MPKISALPPAGTLADDDETPFVDDSVATTKKFTLAGLLVWLQSKTSWITTAMIDWTNGGIWWEELGRTTLSSTGAQVAVSFTPKKYLKVIMIGYADGGVLDTNVTFNNVGTATYANRHSVNFGASVDNVSASAIAIESGQTDSGGINVVTWEIVNIEAEEKSFIFWDNSQEAAGAAALPTLLWSIGKWANTSAQISSIQWNESGAGQFGIGSEIVVLGHD